MQASLEIKHYTKKALYKLIVATLEELNTLKVKEASYAHLEVITLPNKVFKEKTFNEKEIFKNVNRLASTEI